MKQYIVSGMTCASCQSHVEKAAGKVKGVTAATVSLLTNTLTIEGTPEDQDVIAAIADAGYEARPAQTMTATSSSVQEDMLKDRQTPKLKKRLKWSLVFVALLMYLTMGVNMWGWPLPTYFEQNIMALALTQQLLALAVMIINHDFFTSGFKSLLHGMPNMDTLVALGSSISFAWSIAMMYQMSSLLTDGHSNMSLMHLYHNGLYFESAAMIPAFITVGKMLEAMSKGRTTDALKKLIKMAPKTATLEKGDKEETVPIESVQPGDIIIIRPGESIPVDAVIVEGSTAIDESALTGESVPADKNVGDMVQAATINTSGFIKVKAMHVGENTAFAKIIRMVSEAAGTKAPIARIADRISGIFVPGVLIIAALVLVGWLMSGKTVAEALRHAVAVLVISCPCALGLATPVAIMVASGIGASHGILFKTSEAMEAAGKIDILAFDKTGTITKGKPEVTAIIPRDAMREADVLELAYALEAKSEHPLAKAIVHKAEEENIVLHDIVDFKVLSGNGLEGMLQNEKISGGSIRYISTIADVDEKWIAKANMIAGQGQTPLLFSKNGKVQGIIAVADVIREEAKMAIMQLKRLGIETIMLTGDNERTANVIGKEAGVHEVIAGVLPDGKEAVIRRLQKRGKVAMVGDGINDAPALVHADIGIAIGNGTDIAIDSADIVLMNSHLLDIPAAIRLSRKAILNIRENLFWAFAYNLLLIPMAAGLYPGIQISPMWGAAAMSLSSFTVCMNALRLNLFHIYSAQHDRPVKKSKKNPYTCSPDTFKCMQIPVYGMQCENCAKHVCQAVKMINGVLDAKADYAKNSLTIQYVNKPDMEKVKEAIVEAGYSFGNGISTENKEAHKMEKKISIEGMACAHCEARVRKALEGLSGVEKADVSKERKEAIVALSKTVEDAELKKAIEDAGYTVTSICENV